MKEYDSELTARVKKYALEQGAALVGIADAEILNDALEKDFRRRIVCPAVVPLWFLLSIFRMGRWKS